MSTLKEICQKIDGKFKGNPNLEIESVNSLYRAGEKEITFCIKDSLDHDKVKAGALIVKNDSEIDYPNLIYVDNPYLSFAALLNFFFPHKRFNNEIDHRAHISDKAIIGDKVSIGPFSYVGEGCNVGDNSEIHSNVSIYPKVKIGKNCLIYANVVIREEVEIGDNVIIQPGAIIGSDGFGFARLKDGTPVKIPQKGKVIIGNNCEIGANTCIDRSTIEETQLNDHSKLDNLVHIGHNVRIGKATAISALSGISGSVDIGDNVIMGGQVGVTDHIKIVDGVMVAAMTGITGNIKKKGIIAGIPHQEFGKWKKNSVIFRNLEQYVDRIKQLEKKIKEMEEKSK